MRIPVWITLVVTVLGLLQTVNAGAPNYARDMQIFLTGRGYDPGPVDGKPGKRTREAIQAFEKDAGLDVTGDVTPDVWRELREQPLPENFAARTFDTADGCEITMEKSEKGTIKWTEICSTNTGWNPIGADGILRFPDGSPIGP